ncbi:lipopolysaccharide-induced tumor necrosis factor-alpha factor homolog [Saccoglossus kowalevskii]
MTDPPPDYSLTVVSQPPSSHSTQGVNVPQPADNPSYPRQPPIVYNTQLGYPQQQGYPVQGYQTPQLQTKEGHPIPPLPPGTLNVLPGQQQWGEAPSQAYCGNCNKSVMTDTVYKAGTFTWISAGIICLFCLWCGCCLIPFCIKSFKDVHHSCPECKTKLGVFHRDKGL